MSVDPENESNRDSNSGVSGASSPPRRVSSVVMILGEEEPATRFGRNRFPIEVSGMRELDANCEFEEANETSES